MKKTTIIISSLIILAGVIFYSCNKSEDVQVKGEKSILPELKKYLSKKTVTVKSTLYEILSNENNPYDTVGKIIHESIIFSNKNCKTDNSNYSEIYSERINSFSYSIPNFDEITNEEYEILIYNIDLLSVINNGSSDSILIYLYDYISQTNCIENFVIETQELDQKQKERLLYILTIVKNHIGTPAGARIVIDLFYDNKLPTGVTAADIRTYEWLVDDCIRGKLRALYAEPTSLSKLRKIATLPIHFMSEIAVPCFDTAGRQMGWW